MKHVRTITLPRRAQSGIGFLDVLSDVFGFLVTILEGGGATFLTILEFKTQDNGTPVT
jgi:hypothetical protein